MNMLIILLLVYKMLKCPSVFCPQNKDLQLTVTEEQRNQKRVQTCFSLTFQHVIHECWQCTFLQNTETLKHVFMSSVQLYLVTTLV